MAKYLDETGLAHLIKKMMPGMSGRKPGKGCRQMTLLMSTNR